MKEENEEKRGSRDREKIQTGDGTKGVGSRSNARDDLVFEGFYDLELGANVARRRLS